MNYYEAKFARAAKEHPTHWVIRSAPNQPNAFTLVKIR